MNSIGYCAIFLASLLIRTLAKPQYGYGYSGYNQDGTYNPLWNQPPTFSHLDATASNNPIKFSNSDNSVPNNPLYYGDYNYGYNNGAYYNNNNNNGYYTDSQRNRLLKIWPCILNCSDKAITAWMNGGSLICNGLFS